MISQAALVDKFRYALENKWGYIWGAAGKMWTQALQNQKVTYMKNKYGTSWQKNSEAKDDRYYMSAVYGAKWIGHMVADCSGMFVWAFAQLGGPKIAHGSNSIYDRYCSAKGPLSSGKRKDGMVLQPGTAVFTDKNGDKGHIGLYAGNGKVIEAHGVQAGVITSNITETKWKFWGELKGVSYEKETDQSGQPAQADPQDDQLPTIRRGDKGSYVKLAQTNLAERGYSLGSAGIDGDFGPATEKAVKQFQKDWGLDQDGIVGKKTWDLLLSAPVKQKTYTVTIKGLSLDKAKALAKEYTGASYKEE